MAMLAAQSEQVNRAIGDETCGRCRKATSLTPLGPGLLPRSLGRQTIYHPVDRGFEREVGLRLAWWRERRAER